MNNLLPNRLERSHHRAPDSPAYRTILVQCQSAHLGTTYARLGAGLRVIEVALGNMDDGRFFIPSAAHVSVLRLADYPELGALHDGNGWNLPELASFVAGLEDLDGLEL